MTDNNITNEPSGKELLLKGSLIALILTGPSLIAFGLSWYFSQDLIIAAIIGGVVYFIAMFFSIRIAKKFFTRNAKTKTDL